MQKVAPLSNTAGSVLDPIISLWRAVTLNQMKLPLSISPGAAENRETERVSGKRPTFPHG